MNKKVEALLMAALLVACLALAVTLVGAALAMLVCGSPTFAECGS